MIYSERDFSGRGAGTKRQHEIAKAHSAAYLKVRARRERMIAALNQVAEIDRLTHRTLSPRRQNSLVRKALQQIFE